jgi:hypothetical protein
MPVQEAVPDVEFIRTRIPIRDVARELGLAVNGRQGHCWRVDAHRNGDSKPSIWFNRKNRGRCEVCDSQTWSAIDLVMRVEGIGTGAAIRWIAQRFPVPNVPKGKHLTTTRRWKPAFRVGTGGLMEIIVRSGLLAELSGAEVKVLQVLVAFADRNGEVTISYAGIAQYAGVASPSTVRKALLRLQKLHLLEISRKVSGGFRECSSYRLTVDDPQFLALARERSDKTRELVKEQRAMREAQRAEARKRIPRSNLPTTTVAHEDFTLQSRVASNFAQKAEPMSVCTTPSAQQQQKLEKALPSQA